MSTPSKAASTHTQDASQSRLEHRQYTSAELQAMSIDLRKAIQWYHSPENTELLARFGLRCEVNEKHCGLITLYIGKNHVLSLSGFTRDHSALKLNPSNETQSFELTQEGMDRVLSYCGFTAEGAIGSKYRCELAIGRMHSPINLDLTGFLNSEVQP